MSTLSINFTDTVVVVTCWCGINHGIPEGLRNYQLREHEEGRQRMVYCPLGHQHCPAGKSKSARLEQQLAREREALDHARREREHARRSEQAQRAAATRARNERNRDRRRVAHGVCPCCGRSFKQLDRHMQTKHPEFVAGADVEAGVVA